MKLSREDLQRLIDWCDHNELTDYEDLELRDRIVQELTNWRVDEGEAPSGN